MRTERTLGLILLTGALLFMLPVTSQALSGDADNDNKLTVADAQLALSYAIRIGDLSQAEIDSVDIDRDGYVTTDDACAILRAASGIEPITELSYSDWVVVNESTCTKDGYAICTCLETDEQKTKIIKAAGHDLAPADCFNPAKCRACGAVSGSPLGHTTVAGVCKRCNQMIQDAVAANIYGKEIPYGATASKIISLIGYPADSFTDNAKSGNVQILVYTVNPVFPNDYTNLAVFFVTRSGLSAVYTTDTDAKFTDGVITQSITTNNNKTHLGDNVLVQTYFDKAVSSDGVPYALFVLREGYTYQLDDSADISICEKLIFYTTNALRANAGLQPLTYCNKAASVAYSHSLNMARTGNFSHEESDGSRVADRFETAGIDWYAVAENIFCGTGFDPFSVTDGWLNSPSHRRNLLSEKYNCLGVGIAYNKDSLVYYSTQNFYRDYPLS